MREKAGVGGEATKLATVRSWRDGREHRPHPAAPKEARRQVQSVAAAAPWGAEDRCPKSSLQQAPGPVLAPRCWGLVSVA